jgi:alpha-ribazole phosphatase
MFFVRHGRTVAPQDQCIGHTDVALSEDGAEMIRTLVADGLSAKVTRVISSDLCRAMESAAILATTLACPVEHDARLREMSFGDWEGKLWSRIVLDDAEHFHAWTEHWLDVAPPGGESAAELARRAADWMTQLLDVAQADERIVVVSHAGWIRSALTHLFGRDLADLFDIPLDLGRATVVEVSVDGCSVVAENVPRLPRDA